MIDTARQIVWFEDVTRDDVPSVGGKNASLGAGNCAPDP
jgi:pyruvate, water dikinase